MYVYIYNIYIYVTCEYCIYIYVNMYYIYITYILYIYIVYTRPRITEITKS